MRRIEAIKKHFKPLAIRRDNRIALTRNVSATVFSKGVAVRN